MESSRFYAYNFESLRKAQKLILEAILALKLYSFQFPEKQLVVLRQNSRLIISKQPNFIFRYGIKSPLINVLVR